MKPPETFDQAYAEIEAIVRAIESDSVPLDDLAASVQRAKMLISWCEKKLRDIEAQLNGNENDPPEEPA